MDLFTVNDVITKKSGHKQHSMLQKYRMKVVALIFVATICHVLAFVSPSRRVKSNISYQNRLHEDRRFPAKVLQPGQQRQVSTQLMGLFGLGTGEIFLILIGIGVVLGPQKLLEMVRSSPKVLDEYKEELSKIPEEFQKGMEEGEIEARSRKAKPVKRVDATTNKEDI